MAATSKPKKASTLIPDEVIVDVIKQNLGPHWKLMTVTSSRLSSWLPKTTTKQAKELLERLCRNKKAVRAGREDARDRIESEGTTCIQYALIREEQEERNFPIGVWVKHKDHGDGEITFSKPGFPSVKALFSGIERRVPKKELNRI